MTSCDLSVSHAAECSRKSAIFIERRERTGEYVFASHPYGEEENKNRSFCHMNFHSHKAWFNSKYQFPKEYLPFIFEPKALLS